MITFLKRSFITFSWRVNRTWLEAYYDKEIYIIYAKSIVESANVNNVEAVLKKLVARIYEITICLI